MQNLQYCKIVLVFQKHIFSVPQPLKMDRSLAFRSSVDFRAMDYQPNRPTYQYLRNYSKRYTGNICREMINLLHGTNDSPPEVTLLLEVCSPSWIAIMASNKLKRRHPDRYNNKTQYKIQPVSRTPGQTPPPFPKVLLKALAKFGLNDLITTNKRRPDQPRYVVPKQRLYVIPQRRPCTSD